MKEGGGFVKFPKLYTVDDVAKITGLTARTIRNYLKDGKLQGQKVGVQWRFTEENIKDLFIHEDISQDMNMAKHQIVLDFLQKGEIDEPELCSIFAIPRSSGEEAQRLCEPVLELVNKIKKQGSLDFSFQYLNGIARFYLVGEPSLVQQVLALLTK